VPNNRKILLATQLLLARRILTVLLCFLLLYSYSYSASVNIFFSPPVDLNHKLAEYIDNAEESIKGCFYSLHSEEIARSLIKAHLREVQVQIVMDAGTLFTEDSFYPQLKNFCLVKKDTITKGLMHNKFCIIDEKLVWTGSYNPSSYAVYTNNNALVIKSKELADIYLQEFQKLWNAQTVDEDKKCNNEIKIEEDLKVEVYFSPEGGDVLLARMKELLQNAKSSIYFAQFTMTHPDIAEILIEKANAGIDIKGIMEYDQIGAYSQYSKLERAGMDIRKDKNYCFSFHHKFFIIDDKTIITGSLNSTKAGFEKNRENVLIIHSTEAAQEYLRYFKNIR